VNHDSPNRGRKRHAFLLGLVGLIGAACGTEAPQTGSRTEATKPVASRSSLAASNYHATNPVSLRDRSGSPLTPASTTPYSPQRTCGACHDVAKITEGYHFQQGKGTSNSNITVADNYSPVKTWLLSDGMYGKW
jgi:hypothetical protein